MRYYLLGKSGLRVSELALGAMSFGTDWGWGSEINEARKMLDLYVDNGGNFVDTANVYTNGSSEKMLGEFLGEKRQQIVLSTKYTISTHPGDPNGGGNHRKSMARSVERSLQRLKTDYIDLLYLHIWDGTTPVEEILRAMDDLVCAGKVLYVGISDTPAWQISRMQAIADLRGWSPLVALHWLLFKSTVTAVLLGASKLEQLENNLGSLNTHLSADQIKRLDEISRVEMGFPHAILANPTIKHTISGGVEVHRK